MGEDLIDHVDYGDHVFLDEAAGGDGSEADADASRVRKGERVSPGTMFLLRVMPGHGRVLCDLAGDIRVLGAEVDEHQVWLSVPLERLYSPFP